MGGRLEAHLQAERNRDATPEEPAASEERAELAAVQGYCLAIRSAARLVAAVATRAHCFHAEELQPRDLTRWRQMRAQLEQRHEVRRRQLRFRRDPARSLTELEQRLLHPTLPPGKKIRLFWRFTPASFRIVQKPRKPRGILWT